MILILRKYRVALGWATLSATVILYTRFALVPENERLARGNANLRTLDPITEKNSNYHEVTVRKVSAEELAEKYKPRKPKKPSKPEINWPKPWTNKDPKSKGERSSPVTCDMRAITRDLRPLDAGKAAERTFKSLPERYSKMHNPRIVAPTCGGNFISPWKVAEEAKKSRNMWMIYFVKSAPSYVENRKAVRDTWASTNTYKGKKLGIIFLIGKTDDEKIQREIRKESERHGDILQCDIMDGYDALPKKVLSAFRWILMKELKASFYSFTDDDCLIDLRHMQDHFIKVAKNKGFEKNLYCGYVYDEDSEPFRDGKWSLTKELYSGEVFPTFCHGALWTISRPLLRAIYCVSEVTDYEGFFIEDALITGILREKLGFANNNIKKTVDKRTDPVEDLFLFHAGHKSTAETAAKTMRREWKKRQKR